MNEEKVICSYCGRAIEDGEWIETADGLVCETCLSDHYSECYTCGDFHLNEDLTKARISWSKSKYICDKCHNDNTLFFQCDDCEDWFYTQNYSVTETHDGRTICEGCYCDSYFTCNDCGEVFHWDERYEGDDEESYCASCNDKHNVIHPYSFKPDPRIYTTSKRTWDETNVEELIMGVELEIDKGYNRYETAKEITDTCPVVYIKSDGSLGSSGMEIVSNPCSLEYHLQELGWDKICRIAKENSYTSHDARTCGLHVHVGRHQLGKNWEERSGVVTKIIMLVDRHWNFMERFSRRRESQLKQWAAPPGLKIKDKTITKSEAIEKAVEAKGKGRYSAINDNNDSTVEFRLFNGTLKVETIYATLQLVSNICEMAKRLNEEQIMQTRWEDIINYKRHKELTAYIKNRGINELENPSAISFISESKRKEEKEKQVFKVGDIVQIVNSDGWGHHALENGLGEIARIEYVGAESAYENNTITLRFERRFSTELWGADERHYNVEPRNIRRIEFV